MRVLVANPPAYFSNDLTRHFIQAGSRWSFSLKIPKYSGIKDHYLPYPFFLGYTTALLKRDTDAEVKGFDACALDFDDREFIEYVIRYKPDLLIIEVPTVSFPLVMDMLRKIKEDLPELKIAVAGNHITALTRDVMMQYPLIDYALLGEYELTAKELVTHLINGRDSPEYLRSIKGLAFRKGNDIVVNEGRNVIMDLDSLPFPDRDDFDVMHYHDFEIVGKPTVQMLSSRGCPYSCIFCVERHVLYASPIYRKRDPKKVVDEIEFVMERYKAKQIYFDDMNTTLDKRHIIAIAKEIMERKLDIPWACMGDINVDTETLKILAKSGCVGIKFGVETINTEALKMINKLFIYEHKVRKFVETAKSLGLFTHATYTIGLPGDTREGILRTIKFALELNTDSAQFSIATPFPGTPFFELARRNGWLITLDWTKYDGANYAVVSYPHLSNKEIEELYLLASNLWWIKKNEGSLIKHFIKRPQELRGLVRRVGLKGAINMVRYLVEVI